MYLNRLLHVYLTSSELHVCARFLVQACVVVGLNCNVLSHSMLIARHFVGLAMLVCNICCGSAECFLY